MTYDYWPSETLVVGTWSSSCNNCGKNALFSKSGKHDRVGGYTPPDPDVGCGIEWKYVASNYVGLGMKRWAAHNLPDLEWVGYDEEAEGWGA